MQLRCRAKGVIPNAWSLASISLLAVAICAAPNALGQNDLSSDPRTSGGKSTDISEDRPGKPPEVSSNKAAGGRKLGAFLNHPLDLSPLNLTDEQKEKIQKLRSQTAAETRDMRRRLKEGAVQMRDLMFDSSASDAQILSKRDELRRLHNNLEDSQIKDFLAIRALLTSEQKEKLNDVKMNMLGRKEPPSDESKTSESAASNKRIVRNGGSGENTPSSKPLKYSKRPSISNVSAGQSDSSSEFAGRLPAP